MRTVRLGRTFDVVTCFGNAVSYALTDTDLAATAATFAAHAHRAPCSSSTPQCPQLPRRRVPGAHRGTGGHARVPGDLRFRPFTRSGGPDLKRPGSGTSPARPRSRTTPSIACCIGRAEHPARGAGFAGLGMYDNRQFRDSDLTGAIPSDPDVRGMRAASSYAFARYAPRPSAIAANKTVRFTRPLLAFVARRGQAFVLYVARRVRRVDAYSPRPTRFGRS